VAVCFAAAPVAAASTSQKITPQEGMLARLALKHQSLNSLSHRIKGKMNIKAGAVAFTASFTTRTLMARPRQFRTEAEIEFMGKVTRGVSVSDGKTLWDYDPESGAYSEQPIDTEKKVGKWPAWIMD